LSGVLLGLGYASYFGKSIGLLIALAYCAAGASGIMAVVSSEARPLCEWATLLMVVGWTSTLIHGIIRAFQKAAVRDGG